MAKIAIDAGHGLYTEGKRCLKSLDPNETREWQLNERVARYVTSYLQKSGHQVRRLDDITGKTDVPLKTRTNTANSWCADFCVSIHHNAGINGGSGCFKPLCFGKVCYAVRAACTHAKLLQSCPTLCNSLDCSPPGSSVRGILQARILEWAAVPSSRGSS